MRTGRGRGLRAETHVHAALKDDGEVVLAKEAGEDRGDQEQGGGDVADGDRGAGRLEPGEEGALDRRAHKHEQVLGELEEARFPEP